MSRRILWAYQVVSDLPDLDQHVAVPDANGVVESSLHTWMDLLSYGLLFASILFVGYHLWRFLPFYRMVFAEIRSRISMPEHRSNVSLSLSVDNGQVGITTTITVLHDLPPQAEIVEIEELVDERYSDCSSDSYTSC